MSVEREPLQTLMPVHPSTKSYHFLLPEDHSQVDVQEVPLGQVTLAYQPEHVLVPEMSETVTVQDIAEEAVVPEISIKQEVKEVTVLQIPSLRSMIGQSEEISTNEGDFHRVPEPSYVIHPHERAVADDLGFISLSNEVF